MIKYLIIYATRLLNHQYECSHDDLVLKFPVSAFFTLVFIFGHSYSDLHDNENPFLFLVFLSGIWKSY